MRAFAVLFLLLALSISFVASAGEHDLKEKLAQLEKQVQELENLILGVRDSFEKEIVELKPQLFAIEEIVKELSFDFKKNKGLIAVLSDKVGELTKLQPVVLTLQGSVGKLSERLEVAEGKIASLQDTLMGISDRLSANELRVVELQDGVSLIMGRLGEVEAVIEEMRSTVGKLVITADHHKITLSKLHKVISRLTELEPIVESLQAEVERSKAQLSHLWETVRKLEEQPKVFEKELASIKEAIGNLLIATESNRIKLNQLQEALAKLKPQIWEEALAELKAKHQEDVTTLTTQIEELNKKLESTEKKAAAANNLAIFALLAGLAGVVVAIVLQ
jgi:chromosome segregation ATPase